MPRGVLEKSFLLKASRTYYTVSALTIDSLVLIIRNIQLRRNYKSYQLKVKSYQLSALSVKR